MCRNCKMHPTHCLNGQKVTYDNMITGEHCGIIAKALYFPCSGGKQRIRANSTFQSLSNWSTREKTVGQISTFSKEDSVHYYTPGKTSPSPGPISKSKSKIPRVKSKKGNWDFGLSLKSHWPPPPPPNKIPGRQQVGEYRVVNHQPCSRTTLSKQGFRSLSDGEWSSWQH